MSEPLTLDRVRSAQRRATLVNQWRALDRACCDHLRRCTDCTAAVLCPVGQVLWDRTDAAERALPYTGLRRTARSSHAEPDAADPTPWWLNLLAELALVVVVLLAFGLGLLWGTGGIF